MRGLRSLGLLASCLLVLGPTSALGDPEDPGPDPQRVEVPDAGLVLRIPAHWNHAQAMMRKAVDLPPGLQEPSLASEVVTLLTWSFDPQDPVSCELARYEDVPLTLTEHADWYAEQLLADPVTEGDVSSRRFELPVGEAVRVDSGLTGEMSRAWYLFESGGTRYHVTCVAIHPPEDRWLALATSIERLREPVEDGTQALRSPSPP